jgi:hypothetical protein
LYIILGTDPKTMKNIVRRKRKIKQEKTNRKVKQEKVWWEE